MSERRIIGEVCYMEALLVGAALLPALILMIYIYKKDHIEKEPVGMLVMLFIFGALTVVIAGLAEVGAIKGLVGVFDEESVPYIFIENFFIVALAEECSKMLVLRTRTWRSPHFNYTFDAVVYAVCVSLGFAALENVMYVLLRNSFSLALFRGVLSVPGHAIDAVFMGYYYGLAKRGECMGDERAKKHNMRLAIIAPVAIHGFYDFCLTMNNDYFLILFFAFEVFITIYAIRKVRKLSREDSPLIPSLGVPFAQYGSYMHGSSVPYGYDQYMGRPVQQGYPGQPYQQNYQQQNFQPNYQQPNYQSNHLPWYQNGAAQGYPAQNMPQYTAPRNNAAAGGGQNAQYNEMFEQEQQDLSYTQKLLDEELRRSGIEQ